VVSSADGTESRSGDLLKPPADSWPLYHGDYSGKRHSSLAQITPRNVASLGLAWAFQTNQGAEIKSSPLLVDGVLFFTVPDNIWAVDARSGHAIWHYNRPSRASISATAEWRCIKAGSTSHARLPPDLSERQRWNRPLG